MWEALPPEERDRFADWTPRSGKFFAQARSRKPSRSHTGSLFSGRVRRCTPPPSSQKPDEYDKAEYSHRPRKASNRPQGMPFPPDGAGRSIRSIKSPESRTHSPSRKRTSSRADTRAGCVRPSTGLPAQSPTRCEPRRRGKRWQAPRRLGSPRRPRGSPRCHRLPDRRSALESGELVRRVRYLSMRLAVMPQPKVTTEAISGARVAVHPAARVARLRQGRRTLSGRLASSRRPRSADPLRGARPRQSSSTGSDRPARAGSSHPRSVGRGS
jgi:hypothetical protein